MQVTDTLSRVLKAFLCDPAKPQYGYELMKAADVKSGTLYPMLKRLLDDGIVVAEWESASPTPGGRPPRRYYKLTGEGVRQARVALAEHGTDRRPAGMAWPDFGPSPATGLG
ncbi:PadR family transcriptional regulator [Saccharothrix hoggarensis]|uniref:PadR family transcriptional regulator n=1 Tax=Saccharothrix hoggarensis TaxID=913853 RepID=A0ABW3R596_9PSEU